MRLGAGGGLLGGCLLGESAGYWTEPLSALLGLLVMAGGVALAWRAGCPSQSPWRRAGGVLVAGVALGLWLAAGRGDALIGIRQEIAAIEDGTMNRENNPLKNAPHTAQAVTANEWNHPYTREQAAFPAPWTREHKYWTPVGRIDSVYGDRHLVCSCVGMDAYAEA